MNELFIRGLKHARMADDAMYPYDITAVHDIESITFSSPVAFFVGENGSGKSTIVKLLLRLYDPQEGSILLDGKDLREWDPKTLRGRIGVLFQDFFRFQSTLKENVWFGECGRPIDEAKLKGEYIVVIAGAEE